MKDAAVHLDGGHFHNFKVPKRELEKRIDYNQKLFRKRA